MAMRVWATLALTVSALALAVVRLDAATPDGAKPALGTFGLETSAMNTGVKPGDDFYSFVNGRWQERTPIPDDRASWGGFAILRDLSDQRTRELVEAVAAAKHAPGTIAQKVGDYYSSFMDEGRVEAAGAAPLAPFLATIAAINTPAELAAAMGEANRSGVWTPFRISVYPDAKDNSAYAVYLAQGGLGMPDRDYYVGDNSRFIAIRAKYVAHIETMLRLAGLTDPAERAKRVYDLEAKIAAMHWTRAQSRQQDKTYNPVAVADLGTQMPGLDWAAFLNAARLAGQSRLVVEQTTALAGAAALVKSEPLDAWKDYLAFRTISRAAPLLSSAFVAENFAFNGTVLAGTPKLMERWKRGVEGVNRVLGEGVGELYVAKYFPGDAKAKADALVKNVVAAMDQRLQKLEWMAPETKTKARTKLAAFTAKIGYPDKWRDYSALEVVRSDVVGNALRAQRFDYDRRLARLGKPVDRSEWYMSPQTVNAYANPTLNEIVFPAAILQPPFFDPNADPAINYGGIGAIIGHEISHHFDDQGRKYDPTGNLAEWWTAEDVQRFESLTAKLVAQYTAYEPLPGKRVNGELTLGENIADLAGVAVALDAYRLSLGGKPAPVLEGFSGEQRFFLGFGQIWRAKLREQALLAQLVSDPHSPGVYRASVVRNLDAWYEAFNIQPGEKLYLPPAERVRLW